MFDRFDWRWEYEPFDLKGYIPDFALIGAERNTLVEVKHVAGMNDPLFKETEAKINAALGESNYEVLIVSYFLPTIPDRDDQICIGRLCERGVYEGTFYNNEFAAAPMLQWSTGELGFCHEMGSFTDRISGDYDGNWPLNLDENAREIIRKGWAAAGNAVQWKGRAPCSISVGGGAKAA